MATQVFKIDNVDFTGFLTTEGLKWSRNDIDASGVGRDKSGTMRRKRVATKAKLRFSCRDLTHSEMLALNGALFPETVSVTYLDPRQGLRTATFYGSSVEAATLISQGGETIWQGASFSLVEV
ncbi:MAG: hypothetical protein IJI16_06115 [Atopobiaceae bacterium]|nr:hypothetical protein [Atopobiaceae bacterium]